jgi:transglutaminase-like putative cysteine protease
LQLYSARKIKFFRERPERFQSAIRTVVWGIGDCDDKARFIAASLRTFRIPVRFKFLYITLPDGKTVGHVYPQAWLAYPDPKKQQWVSLESVREYPLGYDPEQTARNKGYNVRIDHLGDAAENTAFI